MFGRHVCGMPGGHFAPPGPPFGHRHHEDEEGWPGFGPFGRHARRFRRHAERFFERGDLKYVILDLLKDQPRHGYDVIRALEAHLGGLYTPSPGSVYPTLQLLEDQGLVVGVAQDGKKVYTISDEGRRFLQERSAAVDDVRDRMAAGWGDHSREEMRELLWEVRDFGQLLFRHARRGTFHDPAKLRQVREILGRARREVDASLSAPDRPPIV